MIKIMEGNLLKTDAEALVNTVNCVGHMGKGIALQFKKAFPENYNFYKKACDKGYVRTGRMFIFETGKMFNPRYIINFPTKRHWRGKSEYEDIENGLKALINDIKKRNIRSIAIPPLGCGLGGLDWEKVKPIIERAFSEVPNVEVRLFSPKGSPEARDMPVGTARPRLTIPRALFIKMMQQYSMNAYRLTLLEVQKLAYFLQETGEPLKLKYEEGHYGPYAHNLNKVLEVLEGHYIEGYGDSQKPDVEIKLLPNSSEEADAFLDKNESARKNLEKVYHIIEGFETPYGMELLSSVHWVATHRHPPANNFQDAKQRVQNWSIRKHGMFSDDHLRIAWNRLCNSGLIKNP